MTDDATIEADELARRCGEAMYARDSASQRLGIKLVEIRAGYALMEMIIEPWMANGGGVCHGGLLFALADTAMAFASNSRGASYTGMSTAMEFLAPGKVGDTVVAETSEVHHAGKTASYNVAVRAADGRVIGQFLGRTYRLGGDVITGEHSR